jgi:MerR family transcriptional regulator, thiopeptide resistance regulator
MKLNDKDIYAGVDPEKNERWNKEVDEKYDSEKVAESKRNVGKMSKEQFKSVQKQGEIITMAIGEKMHLKSSFLEVQDLIKQHQKWIENFYACSAEMYRGLGQVYKENPEFTAYYEKVKPGLAAYMCEAMSFYADSIRKN